MSCRCGRWPGISPGSARATKVIVASPCRHWWLVAPVEQLRDCEGAAHYHARCRECGAKRTFPQIVYFGARDLQERYRELLTLAGRRVG